MSLFHDSLNSSLKGIGGGPNYFPLLLKIGSAEGYLFRPIGFAGAVCRSSLNELPSFCYLFRPVHYLQRWRLTSFFPSAGPAYVCYPERKWWRNLCIRDISLIVVEEGSYFVERARKRNLRSAKSNPGNISLHKEAQDEVRVLRATGDAHLGLGSGRVRISGNSLGMARCQSQVASLGKKTRSGRLKFCLHVRVWEQSQYRGGHISEFVRRCPYLMFNAPLVFFCWRRAWRAWSSDFWALWGYEFGNLVLLVRNPRPLIVPCHRCLWKNAKSLACNAELRKCSNEVP